MAARVECPYTVCVGTLLKDVCQLMRQKSFPARALGRVLAAAENNTGANHEGLRVNFVSRPGRHPVSMHTHVAEVVFEA